MYLDLLKRCLLNEIYLDDELRLLYLRRCLAGEETFDFEVYHDIRHHRREDYEKLEAAREIGQFVDRDIHNAGFSHTMIGRKRLDSLHESLEHIRRENIPGDLMECGAWRGGACILMAGFLKYHGIADRKVFVADSFDGLPVSTHEADLATITLDKSAFPELAVSSETVKKNFDVYGLLSEQVVFLEGWFSETLPFAPTRQVALLRLDGDLYSSTMDTLVAMYDRVAPGGIIIVDDYVRPPCKKAVRDFFERREQPMPARVPIDWAGVYMVKP